MQSKSADTIIKVKRLRDGTLGVIFCIHTTPGKDPSVHFSVFVSCDIGFCLNNVSFGSLTEHLHFAVY